LLDVGSAEHRWDGATRRSALAADAPSVHNAAIGRDDAGWSPNHERAGSWRNDDCASWATDAARVVRTRSAIDNSVRFSNGEGQDYRYNSVFHINTRVELVAWIA